jgi:hypothetical protein
MIGLAIPIPVKVVDRNLSTPLFQLGILLVLLRKEVRREER